MKPNETTTSHSTGNNTLLSVSGQTQDVIDKADGMYQALQKLLKDLATDGTAIEGFTDAWNASLLYQQSKLSAACANGAEDKTVSGGLCKCDEHIAVDGLCLTCGLPK